MDDPLISVIVPVYNVEPYLDRCVRSIVNQTYDRLEILLVDDGASDTSGTLCDIWAAQDSRITVIHKTNGGQAEARNYGLMLAAGEWIGFVDSDDLISAHMYSHLYELVQRFQANAAECSMVRFEDSLPDDAFTISDEATVFEGEGIINALIKGRSFSDTVPNMLVKGPIARSVPFDVGKIHEDILWPFRVFSKCSKAVSTTSALYAYYQRQGSTMLSAYSEKRFDGLDALQQRAQEVKRIYPALYPQAERNYAGVCMYQYQSLERQNRTAAHKGFMKTLHQRFRQSDLKAVFRVANLKYKIWYALFWTCPRLTAHLRNALKIGI